MSGKIIEVGMRIDGDAKGAREAISATKNDLVDLGETGEKINLLDGDAARAEALAVELAKVQEQMRAMVAASVGAGIPKTAIESVDQLGQEATTTVAEVGKLNASIEKDGQALKDLQEAAGVAALSISHVGSQSISASNELGLETRQVNALRNAFDAIYNNPNARKIEAEILDINQGLGVLARSADVTGDEFANAFAVAQRRLADLKEKLQSVNSELEKGGSGATALAGGFSKALAPILGVTAALASGQAFVSANIAGESLQRTLEQMKGSAEGARQEIEWLYKTSAQLGIEAISASKAYIQLSAAAKNTSMEGQKTRDVFTAVAGSMAVMGKAGAETEGAILALSQMMSKGVVSQEEWRQQLAERMPGAAQATADAIGITVSELNTMIDSGGVLAEDLLPKLTEGLRKMYGVGNGEIEGTLSSWNRLKNSANETLQFIGQSGVMKAAAAGMEGLGNVIKGVTAGFEVFGTVIGATLGALSDWRNPTKAIHNWKETMTSAIDDIRKKVGLVKTEEEKAAAKADQERAASATQASTSILKVQAAYTATAKSAEDDVKLAVKSAEARQEESKAAINLANAMGTESEKRLAALEGAKRDADALEAVAVARDREAKVAASQVIAMQQVEGEKSDARKKMIKDLQDSADLKQQEAEKSAAAALGARQHAAALETESNAIGDNSSRVSELKAAWEEAQVQQNAVHALRLSGIASAKDEANANIAVAQAGKLYRDSLKDQAGVIESNLRIKQSSISVDQAGIRLAIEQQRSIAEVARATGDEYGATQALLQIKRLEIQLAELTAKAKRAEADAALELVKIDREAAIAKGEVLTKAKEAEFKAREASAQVKKVEGQIAEETANRMRDLANATDFSSRAAGQASGHHDEFSRSLYEVAEAARSALSAVSDLDRYEQNKYKNPVNDGGYLNGGHQASAPVDLTAMMYKKGASIEEARAAMQYYGELYQRNASTMLTGNLGNSTNAARKTNAASSLAMDEALRLAREELKTGQKADLGTSVNDIIARKLATANYAGDFSGDAGSAHQARLIKEAGMEANASTKTIRLKLDAGRGKTAELSAKSQSDVNDFLRVLEAAGAASK